MGKWILVGAMGVTAFLVWKKLNPAPTPAALPVFDPVQSRIAAKAADEAYRQAVTSAHGGNPLFQTWDGQKLVPYSVIIS